MRGDPIKVDIVGLLVKNANDDLANLRAARVPSKMKKEIRRKYAKKYSTRRIRLFSNVYVL